MRQVFIVKPPFKMYISQRLCLLYVNVIFINLFSLHIAALITLSNTYIKDIENYKSVF